MISEAAYTVLFYLISVAAILLALVVVNARRLLRAAVGLMGMLALSAGLYVMLHAEFLAGVQILVYVGGIVVLIVFAIMLTRSSDLLEDHPSSLRRWFGATFSISFMVCSVFALCSSVFATHMPNPSSVDEINKIGLSLLDGGANGYLLPFELISLLLLVAVIGGTVIARKTRPTDQPFTSGGDFQGESIPPFALTQSDSVEGGIQ